MEFIVEFEVYDSPAKRVRLAIVGAVVAGMVASFTTVFLASQGAAARGGRGFQEQFPILMIPAVLILGLLLIMGTLGVRIRIERGTGEVCRVYSLLGLDLRVRKFNLSDFERVSLYRAYRTGYQVSLVGRERELVAFLSANLGSARERANQFAAECGLKVTDQL
jgi:ribosome modulation factor